MIVSDTSIRKSLSSASGFTLIELVLVIIIIGILGSAMIPVYTDIFMSARKASVDYMWGNVAFMVKNVKYTKFISTGSAYLKESDFASYTPPENQLKPEATDLCFVDGSMPTDIDALINDISNANANCAWIIYKD